MSPWGPLVSPLQAVVCGLVLWVNEVPSAFLCPGGGVKVGGVCSAGEPGLGQTARALLCLHIRIQCVKCVSSLSPPKNSLGLQAISSSQ